MGQSSFILYPSPTIMWHQVLVCVLATCVLGEEVSQDGLPRFTRAANLDATAQVPSNEKFEVLSRSVSIKTPVRKSTTISHFTPADHRFDANGQVVINRSRPTTNKVSSTTNTASSSFGTRTVTRKSSSPSDSLSRTVSIKTPKRLSTTISHFTPADLRFDATGSLNINRGFAKGSQTASVPVVKVQRTPKKVSRVVKQKTSNPSLSLTRQVSVKTPVRHSSTISHFTPADHRFDATGQVVINRGSSGVTRTVTSSSSGSSIDVAQLQAEAERAAQLALEQELSRSRSNSDLSVSRTISIKTPTRHSSTISHFTPADLRFDATGSVNINRGSERTSQATTRTTSRNSQRSESASAASTRAAEGRAAAQRAAAERAAALQAAAQADAQRAARRAQAATQKSLSLSRTVSIKTPERKSTVISHFTPAGHRFDATGSVTINRGSDGTQNIEITKVKSTASSASSSNSARSLDTVTAKRQQSTSGQGLSRTVTIKTPERKSTTISHFTPANLNFDATGSVVINRGSGRASGRQPNVAQRATFEARAAAEARASAQARAAAEARAAATKTTAQRSVGQSSSSAGAGSLSLTRTVNVKTPQRASTTISHFTPATHRYDASGQVIINRGSSNVQSSSSSSASSSSSSLTQQSESHV